MKIHHISVKAYMMDFDVNEYIAKLESLGLRYVCRNSLDMSYYGSQCQNCTIHCDLVHYGVIITFATGLATINIYRNYHTEELKARTFDELITGLAVLGYHPAVTVERQRRITNFLS